MIVGGVLGGSELEYVVGFYRCTYIAFRNTVRYQDRRVWSQLKPKSGGCISNVTSSVLVLFFTFGEL